MNKPEHTPDPIAALAELLRRHISDLSALSAERDRLQEVNAELLAALRKIGGPTLYALDQAATMLGGLMDAYHVKGQAKEIGDVICKQLNDSGGALRAAITQAEGAKQRNVKQEAVEARRHCLQLLDEEYEKMDEVPPKGTLGELLKRYFDSLAELQEEAERENAQRDAQPIIHRCSICGTRAEDCICAH